MAGLDGCGKSCPHRDSISGPPSQYRVVIPTTLFRPTDCLLKAPNSTMSCGREIKLQGTRGHCDILKCRCTRCMRCWYMRQHCCATTLGDLCSVIMRGPWHGRVRIPCPQDPRHAATHILEGAGRSSIQLKIAIL